MSAGAREELHVVSVGSVRCSLKLTASAKFMEFASAKCYETLSAIVQFYGAEGITDGQTDMPTIIVLFVEL